MKVDRNKSVIILILVIWTIAIFSLKQCAIHKTHKGGRHYIEYVSHGITNKMYFHSDNNSYVGSLKEHDGKYILTVVDTATEKKYILMSDETIRIKGGDINVKIN